MKRGKNYVSAASAIEKSKQYDVQDAIQLLISNSKAKFDETVEAHFRLGVDGRNADQQVRGVVVLPNGTGKALKFW